MPWTSTVTRSSGFLVTAAVWNNEHVNNMQFLEEVAAATDVTSNVVIDVTTTATSTLIIALPTTTYEAVPHELWFDGPGLQRTEVATVSPSTFIGLYDGAAGSHMGHLCQLQQSSTGTMAVPIHIRHRFTPTAASHTYQIRGHNNTADSWTHLAGAGGSGVHMPISCSIRRIPT